MAIPDISNYSARDNVEGQTQGNASLESWLSHVKSTFNPPRQIWQVSTKVCIYRVLKCIRINNPEYYYPCDISFGPYHHRRDPHLCRMDQYKLEALHRMVARLKIDVSTMIAEVRKLENEIRECYAEPIEWDGETLCWMLTMDACFILEFCKSVGQTRRESDRNYFSLVFQNLNVVNIVYLEISNDIIKLENQIPLCILVTLLKLEFQTFEKATEMLAELLYEIPIFEGFPFYPSVSVEVSKKKLKEEMRKNPPPCHLLDLYRIMVKNLLTHSSLLSSSRAIVISNDPNKSGWWRSSNFNQQSFKDSRSTPCAQLLKGAGIKFYPGKLRFEKKWFGSSTLYLPQICVDEYTENFLRNLMAYEECQRCSWSPHEAVISQYVYLFDDLIDSEKDVAILRKTGIIVNLSATDNETAQMFNHLKYGIAFHPNENMETVMRKVREHYRSQWKVWLTQFKQEYFSRPWYFFSLVGAVLILGMTAVQTVYSVKK